MALASPYTLAEHELKHPLSWSPAKKWAHLCIMSLIEFVTPLASMMFAPEASQVAADIAQHNIAEVSLSVSIYVLGFGIGPIVFAPVSDVVGRIIIYRIVVFGYACMSVGCAMSNSVGMLIAFRFLAGCFGAAPIAIGAAAVADIFKSEERGKAIGIYSMGSLIGAGIGPILGSCITYASNWRWTFWAVTIASGTLAFVTLFYLEETHPATIARKAQFREGGKSSKTKRANISNWMHVFYLACTSPFKIFFSSYSILLLFILNAAYIGYINIIYTTLGFTYQTVYRFNALTAGLAYLGMGLGSLSSAILFARSSDRFVALLRRKWQIDSSGLCRLPFLAFGVLISSVGFLWYGWAIDRGSAWIVPILGTYGIGLGSLFIQLSISTYLVDSFPDQTAAAQAASLVTRAIGAAVIPITGPSLYTKLGYGWGNTLLGILSFLLVVPLAGLVLTSTHSTDARTHQTSPEAPEAHTVERNTG